MVEFFPVDFSLTVDNSLTLDVPVTDACREFIAPIAGSTGRFSIATWAPAPPYTRIFQRDSVTNPADVWFTYLAPIWTLLANIYPSDTISLPVGKYVYQFRVDTPTGDHYTIKTGYFLLTTSFITP